MDSADRSPYTGVAMNAVPIQFGTSLGSFVDLDTGETVGGKLFGEARLQVQDPAAFSAAAARAGGDAALVAWVQASLAKAFAEAVHALVATTPLKKALAGVHALNDAVVARINADLRETGATLQIGSASIQLNDGDGARLQAAARARAEQARAAPAAPQAPAPPGPLPAGTAVSVTWSDGQSYPATVRGFNGTHYEIAWDGGAGAWVAPSAVRRR
jgi:hypothetical protein